MVRQNLQLHLEQKVRFAFMCIWKLCWYASYTYLYILYTYESQQYIHIRICICMYTHSCRYITVTVISSMHTIHLYCIYNWPQYTSHILTDMRKKCNISTLAPLEFLGKNLVQQRGIGADILFQIPHLALEFRIF